MSAEVDWRQKHDAEQCNYEPCYYCGCCSHGRPRSDGCKVDRAPTGMRCPNDYCGCEGRT